MNRTATIATIAIVVCVSFPADGYGLPVLWSGNGHYYDIVSYQGSWDAARAHAETVSYAGLQGHLATVTTAAESDFILGSLTLPYASWIGGFQPDDSPEPDGGWLWVTGETWSFANWAPGEPNNDSPWMGSEDSVILYSTGVWNDGHGWDAESNYVIEFDAAPVPEPTVALLLASGLVALVSVRRMSRKRRAGSREP